MLVLAPVGFAVFRYFCSLQRRKVKKAIGVYTADGADQPANGGSVPWSNTGKVYVSPLLAHAKSQKLGEQLRSKQALGDSLFILACI